MSDYQTRGDHFVAALDEHPISAVDEVVVSDKVSNLWLDAWRDIRKRALFWFSAVVVLLIVTVALFPSWFTSVDPTTCMLELSNGSPAPGHPFGFNRQGCDVYARVIYGTNASLTVGLLAVSISTVIGVIFGALGGFYGKWIDAVLSRIGDIFFSIPYILAAVVIMSVFSQYRNVLMVAFAIGGFAWPGVARVLRSEILRVKNSDFVTASTALGRSRVKTLFLHVLPNSIAPLIVLTTLSLGSAIVAEATLSFLGVGLPGTVMSWGNDISTAQSDIRTNPMTLLYPSMALTITVLAFIMLGEVLRDALDPQARAAR